MDWEGIRTAILDVERRKLGLPSRADEMATRAKQAQEAALSASNLETAGLGREKTRAEIAGMPGQMERRGRLEEATIRNLDEPNRQPPTLTGDAYVLSLPPDKREELLKFKGSIAAASRAPHDTSASDAARSDRSYQFHATQLASVAKPFEQQNERLARLESTLQAGTPQADALVAPELLTIMAGGQGSGLRMNEAEIARIIGGRSNLEGLKAAANQWALDPTSANSITPAQRSQIHTLVQTARQHMDQQMSFINAAGQALTSANDIHEHRRILSEMRNHLSSPPAASDEIGIVAPGAPAGIDPEVEKRLKLLGY